MSSISHCFLTPLLSISQQQPKQTPNQRSITLPKPLINPITKLPPSSNLFTKIPRRIYCSGLNENVENLGSVVHPPEKPRWENWLAIAASLYPFYITVGGAFALLKPSTFSWFSTLGPSSYSLTLMFIMLSMGITLEFKGQSLPPKTSLYSFRLCCSIHDYACFRSDNQQVVGALTFSLSRPHISLLLPRRDCVQRVLQVTLIAQGDVPLSIVMTVCTTLGAVILTPLLTKFLAGTYVPVNAVNLSISTLQVVVAPILLGSYLQSTFPKAVKLVTPFAPLVAVLSASLLACSVFSENVIRLKSSAFAASLSSELSPFVRAQAMLSSEFGVVVLSVLLLHFAGFFVGYLSAALGGFKEPQRRAVSIEVGMQNSSLGVVLATAHFTSPMVALPSAISAVIMNIMGSSLGFFWRYINPSEPNNHLEVPNE